MRLRDAIVIGLSIIVASIVVAAVIRPHSSEVDAGTRHNTLTTTAATVLPAATAPPSSDPESQALLKRRLEAEARRAEAEALSAQAAVRRDADERLRANAHADGLAVFRDAHPNRVIHEFTLSDPAVSDSLTSDERRRGARYKVTANCRVKTNAIVFANTTFHLLTLLYDGSFHLMPRESYDTTISEMNFSAK